MDWQMIGAHTKHGQHLERDDHREGQYGLRYARTVDAYISRAEGDDQNGIRRRARLLSSP